MFRFMRQQPPSHPKRLYGIIQTPMMRIRPRDAAHPLRVPQRRPHSPKGGPQPDRFRHHIQHDDARGMVQLVRRNRRPPRVQDLRERAGLDRLGGHEVGGPVGEPGLQLVPEGDPAVLEGGAGAAVLLAELEEAGSMGEELADAGAEVDGVVGVHVGVGGGVEEGAGRWSGGGVAGGGGEPLRRWQEGGFGSVRYESSADIWCNMERLAEFFLRRAATRGGTAGTDPFVRSTRRRLGGVRR